MDKVAERSRALEDRGARFPAVARVFGGHVFADAFKDGFGIEGGE
jgi:hypothetical protein